MTVRVLLVDDEPYVLAALRRLLLRKGFEVATAPTAEAALALLETYLPHVVISDFKLPGMNGSQLLATVSQVLPRARRALLSGYAEVGGTKFEGTFLRKPWNDAELVSLCTQGALSPRRRSRRPDALVW